MSFESLETVQTGLFLKNNCNFSSCSNRGCVPRNTAVRLIDFGTAEFCANDKYRHALVGTRQYRAPEVLFGSGWNHTLDIWAVGCVATEMLCGRQLFPAVCFS
jgi:serine/threonine protein kinase